MNNVDVIVVGAGAAGLMCAIEAGKRGRKTLVLDHANKPGKKILMSGGGRCNFTNLNVTPDNFISHNPHFCKSALSRYQPQHFIELVQKHRIPYHEKTLGQLFCDNKAKDIVNLLLSECGQAGSQVQLNTSIEQIKQLDNNHFLLKTNHGLYQCQSLVIATGGLSIPTLGASPFGYKVAEQFDLKVYPTRAGLVPFTLHNHDKSKFTGISGVAVDCEVSCNKQSFREAMLFTHRGLSGPAMLQISSYWQPGDSLSIDLLPANDIEHELQSAKQQQPNIQLKNWLHQWLAKKIIETLLSESLGKKTLAQLSKADIERLQRICHHWQLKPNNTEGYRTAEVTLGGIDTNAISSKTFECHTIKNMYFIGEVLDVSGWLGGYNFQWAWASGHAAGHSV